MTNITNREKFARLDTMIWKRRKIDSKGRTVLPIKLRRILGLNGHSVIVWVQVHHKTDKQNEFMIEVMVEK